MAENANTVWADGPLGTPYQPEKSRIRAWGTWLESFVTAISDNAGTIFTTRAALFADLAHPASTMAWVVQDPTAAYNGIYQKSGVSGSGSWTRLSDLPYSFITAVDAGAGTPNAIVATSSLPISASALVIMNVFEANTASPVTVAFNGGSALTIKTNTGNDVSAGGLVAGMQLLGVVTGSTFRLVSDQVSSAVVAAAEAAANAAAASQSAAGTSATNAAASAVLAQEWATNPEDVIVSGGLYSAFHWAQKAAAVVTGGIAAAIHAATAKTSFVDADEIGFWDSVSGALRKITLANFWAQAKWRSNKVGEIYMVNTALTGVDIPPSSTTDTVWIELTAGLTGGGGFNNGKLTSESVSGSAPLVLATAVISFAGSPMNGQTVDLLNTEGRFLRPSTSPGTKQNDAMQNVTASVSGMWGSSGSATGAFSINTGSPSTNGASASNSSRTISYDASTVARTDTETRVKNVGVKAYMRIK